MKVNETLLSGASDSFEHWMDTNVTATVLQIVYLIFVTAFVYTVNFILLALIVTTETFHTASYIFLSCYAMCDILAVSIYNIPAVVLLLQSSSQPNVVFCYFQAFVGWLDIMTAVMILAMLSYEKFYSLHKPLHYSLVFTSRRAWAIVSLIVVCFTVTGIAVTHTTGAVYEKAFLICLLPWNDISSQRGPTFIALYIIQNAQFYATVILTLYSYIRIYYIVLSQQAQMTQQILTAPNQESFANKIRTIHSVFLAVIAFWVTWIPYLVAYFIPETDKQNSYTYRRIAAFLLFTVTPVINPFIHMKGNVDLRACFKAVFVKACCNKKDCMDTSPTSVRAVNTVHNTCSLSSRNSSHASRSIV